VLTTANATEFLGPNQNASITILVFTISEDIHVIQRSRTLFLTEHGSTAIHCRVKLHQKRIFIFKAELENPERDVQNFILSIVLYKTGGGLTTCRVYSISHS
jgi:hypothetical protein